MIRLIKHFMTSLAEITILKFHQPEEEVKWIILWIPVYISRVSGFGSLFLFSILSAGAEKFNNYISVEG